MPTGRHSRPDRPHRRGGYRPDFGGKRPPKTGHYPPKKYAYLHKSKNF